MQAGERNKIIEKKKQECRAKVFDAEQRLMSLNKILDTLESKLALALTEYTTIKTQKDQELAQKM